MADIDATVEKAFTQRYNVRGYPTIYFYHDGEYRFYNGEYNIYL